MMNLPYTYTPYIWPNLLSGLVVFFLGVYAWRHRRVPGALPLAILMFFSALWAACGALELAAANDSTKIFWSMFAAGVCRMPILIARFVFVLAFAGYFHLLTRRNLLLLSIPALIVLLLIITNDLAWMGYPGHHWMVSATVVDGGVRLVNGTGGWITTGFGFVLLLITCIILVRLFVYSPSRRWPVALLLCAILTTHTIFMLEYFNINPFAPMSFTILSMSVTFAMYALALFRFHILDPIPEARKKVIEQMHEGMLVVDTNGKIVDLNPTMESILDKPSTRVRGQDVAEVLPACARMSGKEAQGGRVLPTEISLMTSNSLRQYVLSLSPLKDHRDVLLGQLFLLHDVTEQKQAQAQLLEQQRALATLQERERLARELHDNAGQVLGYVSMQAQAICKWVHDGETAHAETQLLNLANAAQEAHIDLRESIFNLKTGSTAQWSFQATLEQHLAAFRNNYGICSEMSFPDWLQEDTFLPGTGVQLLRVIQEALSNARRHGQASFVKVSFEKDDHQVLILVADDGCGFDPDQVNLRAGDHFGMAFMKERLDQIGGQAKIISQPGEGTQVLLQVPI